LVKGSSMVEPSDKDTRPLPDDAVTLMTSPFDRTSLGQLRGELTACGASNGLTDLNLSNFVLAVNEIATNAVRHGGGQGRLAVWRQADELWCEIVDTGGGIPSGRVNGFHRPQPGHIGGWGLWLARHICKSVDIESGRGGTRVVLRYPIPPPAPG
jgi:anti-sigma regulatory factor (Ser/Thr protein kinase)